MYWRLPAALALLTATMSLPADQTDPRLNDLFEQLKDASDETAASDTANAIWKIWFESRDPESTKLLQEAVVAKQAGDYTLALDTINKVLARSPDFAEAWNQRAIIYYNVGYYDASLADVEQTL